MTQRSLGVVLVGCLTACAAGGEDTSTGSPGTFGSDDSATSSGESSGASSDASSTDATGTDTTSDDSAGDGDSAGTESDTGSTGTGPDMPESCAEPCDAPPSSCYETMGACEAGTCVYTPLIAGSSCGDPCGGAGICDAMGTCIGGGMGGGCDRPHTVGGTCGASGCEGWSCESGWENCDGDWDDGCEVDLSDPATCGDCSTSCTAGPNAMATCDGTSCNQACTGDYENCDGDWANGCEVPTGVANQCSGAGLDPVDGCWTAYCGSSTSSGATNFGTYYCIHCANCNEPAAGQWRWCSSSSGTWFPAEAGNCNSADEDLVCGP